MEEDIQRCGNEFGTLAELIARIRHRAGPPPDPPGPDWKALTEVAVGLQSLVFSAHINDRAISSALGKLGVNQANRGLSQIEVS